MTFLLFACEDLEYVDFKELRGVLVVVDFGCWIWKWEKGKLFGFIYSRDLDVVCHAELARLRLQAESFFLTANFLTNQTQPLIQIEMGHFLGHSFRIHGTDDRAQQTRYEFEERSSNGKSNYCGVGLSKNNAKPDPPLTCPTITLPP